MKKSKTQIVCKGDYDKLTDAQKAAVRFTANMRIKALELAAIEWEEQHKEEQNTEE